LNRDGAIPVAVIGAGHLGTYHARIYASHPRVRLVGVVDIVRDRAEALAAETGSMAAGHVRELPPVRAVSVATPTSTHLQVARECMETGCHVLVEKPLAASVEEGRALVGEAGERRLVLGVGHTERFNPAFVAAADHIGEPRFIEAHRLSSFVPRSLDVDVVLDLMSHDLDLVLAMVRRPVVQVDASGVGVLTPREDIANARVRFAGGTVANLTASRISREKMRKIRFFGSGQYLSVDLLERRVQRAWLSGPPDGADGTTDVAGDTTGDPTARIHWEARDLSAANPLADEIDDFVRAVECGGRTRVPGEDGLRVLELAHEVLARVQEGHREMGF
jgi:predicted dehydrogenase